MNIKEALRSAGVQAPRATVERQQQPRLALFDDVRLGAQFKHLLVVRNTATAPWSVKHDALPLNVKAFMRGAQLDLAATPDVFVKVGASRAVNLRTKQECVFDPRAVVAWVKGPTEYVLPCGKRVYANYFAV